jgi:hypothetical protein
VNQNENLSVVFSLEQACGATTDSFSGPTLESNKCDIPVRERQSFFFFGIALSCTIYESSGMRWGTTVHNNNKKCREAVQGFKLSKQYDLILESPNVKK